jgi:hypothetical protein
MCVALVVLAGTARAELPVPETTSTNVPPHLFVPEPQRGSSLTNIGTEATALPGGRRPTAAVEPSLVFETIRFPTQAPSLLSLANGQEIAGRLEKVADGILYWQLPASTNLLQVRLADLKTLELLTPGTTNPPASTTWLVGLTDGSLVRAGQVSSTGDRLTADLAVAGRVTLARRHVASLRRVAQGLNELVSLSDAPVYSPDPSAPVTQYTGLRRYRDVALPDPLVIEFPWRHRSTFNTTLSLFVGRPERMAEIVTLTLTERSLLMYVSELHVPAVDCLRGALTNQLSHSSWLAVTVNRGTGYVAGYVEHRQLERAALPRGLKLADYGVSTLLDPQGRTWPHALIVSRCGETGALPEVARETDTLVLVNYDALTGHLEAVTSNSVVFTGPTGRMELPLDRVARIHLANEATSAGSTGEMLFDLAGGETVRGTLQRVDGATVVITSPALGTVTVPRPALVRVDGQPDRSLPALVQPPKGRRGR